MATKTSHFMRPLVALVALVAAMAAILIAYSASPARAAGICFPTTAGTTACTYIPTGAEDTFEVPLGVSTIHVEATGAPGAVGLFGGTAGRGAQVSGDLTVTPDQTLYVNVGGAPPTSDPRFSCLPGVACAGGFNGGGSGRNTGGGGGGASDVRTVSRAENESLASRLIVAGGGGGSGTGGGNCNLLGGNGGNAGLDGVDGASCGSLAGGTGAEAGGQSAGSGLGGSPGGGNGSLGQGGDGGSSNGGGGGGGGGYYGGGGGGHSVLAPDFSAQAPAGGGGGGSSLDPDGGDPPTIAIGGPSVTITYTTTTTPADTTPPVLTVPGPITNEATSPDGAVVTFKATAEDAVDGSVEVSCTPPSGSTFPIATREVSCSATDAAGNDSTATFFVTVRDTTAPSITAPPNSTVEATSPNGAVVKYGTDAANSCSATDIADHNPTITYSGGALPSGSTFPIGTTLIPCFAYDSSGNSSTATFTVTVRDTKAPTVTCSVTPNKLSLPANNHKLVGITTTVQVTDSGSGPNGFKLVSVKSSQPDSGLGPDDVAGDMPNWTTGTADTSGQLRAERYGKDRVYTLNYEGYDKAGNKATCSATVTVPKKGG
jgi:hypothetical protein